MSLDGLVDNLLDCRETPLWFPPDLSTEKIDLISRCTSCTVRLVANIAGPGKIRNTVDGFSIDENPQTLFFYNGLEHNLREAYLVLPGAHRLPGEANVAIAELQLYFKGSYDGTKEYCLCIPVQLGDKQGSEYFKSLTYSGTAKRPTVGSIVPKSQWVQYKGADLRGRSKQDSRPRKLCDPVQKLVTYLVCLQPTFMLPGTLERLTKECKDYQDYKGPAVPLAAISLARATTLLTLVPEVRLDAPHSTNTGPVSGDGSIALKQMKCHRLDTKRDIKGDRVYLGGKGTPGSSLDQELQRAADLDKELYGEGEATIQPGHIEGVLAIVMGVVFAIVVCATLAYIILRFTYKDYLPVVNTLYKDSVKPASKFSVPIFQWVFDLLAKLCTKAKIISQSK
jgi:hypothetical protein